MYGTSRLTYISFADAEHVLKRCGAFVLYPTGLDYAVPYSLDYRGSLAKAECVFRGTGTIIGWHETIHAATC